LELRSFVLGGILTLIGSGIYIINPDNRDEVIKRLYNADMTFLIEDTYAVTTKLFEYLATGIPVLAISQSKEMHELIRKYSPQSYLISDNDPEKIREAILDAYHKWKKGKLKNYVSKEYLQKFNRKYQTKQLAKVFDEVLKQHDR